MDFFLILCFGYILCLAKSFALKFLLFSNIVLRIFFINTYYHHNILLTCGVNTALVIKVYICGYTVKLGSNELYGTMEICLLYQ